MDGRSQNRKSLNGLTNITADDLEVSTLEVDTITLNNIKLNNAVANKYVKTDSNKKLVTTNEVPVLTTTDQTIGGNKTFSNIIQGSVSGNAGSATILATSRNIAGQPFNGGADIDIASTDLSNTTNIALLDNTQTFSGSKTFSSQINGSISGSSTSCSGNAQTATQLQTARTIAGQSFNGTANITIASTDLSNTANIALLDNTQTFTGTKTFRSTNDHDIEPTEISYDLAWGGGGGLLTGTAPSLFHSGSQMWFRSKTNNNETSYHFATMLSSDSSYGQTGYLRMDIHSTEGIRFNAIGKNYASSTVPDMGFMCQTKKYLFDGGVGGNDIYIDVGSMEIAKYSNNTKQSNGITFNGNLTGSSASCNGNAGTATILQTARNIAGQSFNGSADITIASTDLSNTSNIALLDNTQTFTGSKTFSNTITGSISGNAGTATQLQTARTIAGQSFNGTANITIASTDLSNTSNIALLDNTQTFSGAKTFTSGITATGDTFIKNNDTLEQGIKIKGTGISGDEVPVVFGFSPERVLVENGTMAVCSGSSTSSRRFKIENLLSGGAFLRIKNSEGEFAWGCNGGSFYIYDYTAQLIRYLLNSSGHHDFYAGNITTTGNVSCANLTTTGTSSINNVTTTGTFTFGGEIECGFNNINNCSQFEMPATDDTQTYRLMIIRPFDYPSSALPYNPKGTVTPSDQKFARFHTNRADVWFSQTSSDNSIFGNVTLGIVSGTYTADTGASVNYQGRYWFDSNGLTLNKSFDTDLYVKSPNFVLDAGKITSTDGVIDCDNDNILTTGNVECGNLLSYTTGTDRTFAGGITDIFDTVSSQRGIRVRNVTGDNIPILIGDTSLTTSHSEAGTIVRFNFSSSSTRRVQMKNEGSGAFFLKLTNSEHTYGIGTDDSNYEIYDYDVGAFRYKIDSSGHHDFQAGNLTTTGNLTVGDINFDDDFSLTTTQSGSTYYLNLKLNGTGATFSDSQISWVHRGSDIGSQYMENGGSSSASTKYCGFYPQDMRNTNIFRTTSNTYLPYFQRGSYASDDAGNVATTSYGLNQIWVPWGDNSGGRPVRELRVGTTLYVAQGNNARDGFSTWRYYDTTSTFTASHSCSSKTIDFKSNQTPFLNGRLVEIDPDADYNDGDGWTATIDEALPQVKFTETKASKKVLGVISYKLRGTHNPIQSIGEGCMWVCNEDGNIEVGDLLISSSHQGYATKQSDDLIRNYTVGKSTCNCNFIIGEGNCSISGNIEINTEQGFSIIATDNTLTIGEVTLNYTGTIKRLDEDSDIVLIENGTITASGNYPFHHNIGKGVQINSYIKINGTVDSCNSVMKLPCFENNGIRYSFIGCIYSGG